jgi:hypothetical protein
MNPQRLKLLYKERQTMSDFLTWNAIYTVAGAAAVTAYAVQFLKQFNFIKKLNSQGVAYVIALIVITAATYFTDNLTSSTAAMIPISALIVCFSSNGAYDSVSKSISSGTQSVISLVNDITTTFTKAIDSLKASVQSIGDTLTHKADNVPTDAGQSTEVLSTEQKQSDADTSTQQIVDSQETANDTIPQPTNQ